MRLIYVLSLCAAFAVAVPLLAGCPTTPDENGAEADNGNDYENGAPTEPNGDGEDTPGNGEADQPEPGTELDDPDEETRDPEDVLDPNTVQAEDEARMEPPPPGDGAVNEVTVGDPVPQFSLPRIDALETNVTPEEFLGRWTLIKFWSSWCPGCKESAVQLIDPLHREYAGEEDGALKVVSIGMEAGDSPERQIAFAQEEDLGWLKLFDRPLSEPESAVSLFGAVSVPSAVLVDPEGTIVTYGSLEREEWTNHLVAYFNYLFDEEAE